MSDFWSTVLGETPAPAPPPPEADLPWWQRTVVNLPAQPVEQPYRPVPQQPQEDPHEDATLKRTQWSRESTGNCPNCMSTNYDRHPEYPAARPRCFDCGYPLIQAGSGAAVQGDAAGKVPAARQIAAAKTNNFNPKEIVHHMHPQSKG